MFVFSFTQSSWLTWFWFYLFLRVLCTYAHQVNIVLISSDSDRNSLPPPGCWWLFYVFSVYFEVYHTHCCFTCFLHARLRVFLVFECDADGVRTLFSPLAFCMSVRRAVLCCAMFCVVFSPLLQAALRQQQQRLLLLRHASKCPAEGEQCKVTPHCQAMKRLWKHIAECKNQQCHVSCFSFGGLSRPPPPPFPPSLPHA